MVRSAVLLMLAGTALACRAEVAPGTDMPVLNPGASAGANAPVAAPGQNAIPLIGRVDGDTYVSPTGAFKIVAPVLPELGGVVTDTGNVVTFQDDFNTLVSIAAFPANATERWKLQVHGPRDYLIEFFKDYVMPDFKHAFPSMTVDDDAIFVPNLKDGGLIIYMSLPGGSMFASKVVRLDPQMPMPAARRGNLLFLHNGYIFVISVELAERITEGTAYGLTPDEEKTELRERLEDVLHRLQFLGPAPQS